MSGSEVELIIEVVPIADLKPHPRNYRSHPEDQLAHIVQSIKENGVYRNIVIADDNTILAGHGVVEAAKLAGLTEIPVRRFPYGPESPQAIKLLTSDNEVTHLAFNDDRALTELLKEIKNADETIGLLGTGFDEMMLANLVYVTRPKSEIATMDKAAAWAGLPDYQEKGERFRLFIEFDTDEDMAAFMKRYKDEIKFQEKGNNYIGLWPPRDRHDMKSVKFESAQGGA